jgi:glucosamine 6-phosphate synthetase-like amidotransferase/phosphosugar isomerase protein
MCGIAFVINYGTDLLDIDFVERMFVNMDDRGGDAAGYYFERFKKGKVIRRLVKGPIRGEDLFDEVHTDSKDISKAEKAFNSKYAIDGSEKLVILHTRKRTHGTEYNNNNNMPIHSKDWILVHNGVVSADRLNSFPYKGEVDSEEILARLQMYDGDFEKALPEVGGSMSIIAKRFKSDELYLYRNSNPLDLLFQPDTNVLVGISCAEYAMNFSTRKEMRNFFKEKGIATCQTTPNTLYRISMLEHDIVEVADIETKERGSTNTSTSASTTEQIYGQNFGGRGCED